MYSFRQAILNSTDGRYPNVIYLDGVRDQIEYYDIGRKHSPQTLKLKQLIAQLATSRRRS